MDHPVQPGPDGVPSGHEGRPARGATPLGVKVLQADPLRGQLGQVRGEDGRVVPRDVVVA